MEHAEYIREAIVLEPNLDIGFANITKDMLQPYTPFHWHESFELICFLQGQAEFMRMPGQKQLCRAGEVICIHPYEIHDMRPAANSEFILVMIPDSFVRKYIPESEKMKITLPGLGQSAVTDSKIARMCKIFEDMLIAQTFKERGYLLRIESLLFELLYQLYHSFSEPPGEGDSDHENGNYRRLQTIAAYVHANFQHPISIREISDVVHLQPEYFCRYFKKNFGKTFFNYLYEVRLFNIEQELLQTKQPIEQIAGRNGFTSPELFRRKFYEKNQCTPSAFRKDHPDNSLPFEKEAGTEAPGS